MCVAARRHGGAVESAGDCSSSWWTPFLTSVRIQASGQNCTERVTPAKRACYGCTYWDHDTKAVNVPLEVLLELWQEELSERHECFADIAESVHANVEELVDERLHGGVARCWPSSWKWLESLLYVEYVWK